VLLEPTLAQRYLDRGNFYNCPISGDSRSPHLVIASIAASLGDPLAQTIGTFVSPLGGREEFVLSMAFEEGSTTAFLLMHDSSSSTTYQVYENGATNSYMATNRPRRVRTYIARALNPVEAEDLQRRSGKTPIFLYSFS